MDRQEEFDARFNPKAYYEFLKTRRPDEVLGDGECTPIGVFLKTLYPGAVIEDGWRVIIQIEGKPVQLQADDELLDLDSDYAMDFVIDGAKAFRVGRLLEGFDDEFVAALTG